MLLRFNSFNKPNSLKLKRLKKGHVVGKDVLKVKATLRCRHVKKIEKTVMSPMLRREHCAVNVSNEPFM